MRTKIASTNLHERIKSFAFTRRIIGRGENGGCVAALVGWHLIFPNEILENNTFLGLATSCSDV